MCFELYFVIFSLCYGGLAYELLDVLVLPSCYSPPILINCCLWIACALASYSSLLEIIPFFVALVCSCLQEEQEEISPISFSALHSGKSSSFSLIFVQCKSEDTFVLSVGGLHIHARIGMLWIYMDISLNLQVHMH